MTKKEIIEETANFYNLTNRGITLSGECVYYVTDTHKCCAVGRCLKDPESFQNKVALYLNTDITSIVNEGLDIKNLFKEEYSGHSVDFWDDLQYFHDKSLNWSVSGLTKHGLQSKNDLLEKHE